jgi:CRISPR/Cas system CSM-associated protein Csm2 small subunit
MSISVFPARADTEKDAQKKAEEIHRRASSDAIYADDELKALYYQNVQIIDLLKEIRELIKMQIELERGKDRP